MRKIAILFGACFWLFVACGGKHELAQPQHPISETDVHYAAEPDDDFEEPLAPSLSAQRLEELYGKTSSPDIEAALKQEMKKWELQKTFDIPIQINKQVRNYIYYFSTDRKEIFSRYLARSTRYLPMIKKIFAEYGLPEDLAYLALVESGFSNRARSSANAVGMWQFIKGTAIRYGLRVDTYIDERRDPEKATHAAAKYLLDLYKQFGSWYLAAASYNCGEGRVQKEIDRNLDAKSYWELVEKYSLPTETSNYVPQMIAATIIAKSPEKYGFRNIPYQPPLKYEQVKVSEPTSLQAVAVATGTSLEEIADLNPELIRKVTPPEYSAYLLKIPPGKKEAFLANIELARAQFPAGSVWLASDQSEEPRRIANGKRNGRNGSAVAACRTVTSKTRSQAVVVTRKTKPVRSQPAVVAKAQAMPVPAPARTGKPVLVAAAPKAPKAEPAGARKPAVGTRPPARDEREIAGPVTASIFPGAGLKAKSKTAEASRKPAAQRGKMAEADAKEEKKKKPSATVAQKPPEKKKRNL